MIDREMQNENNFLVYANETKRRLERGELALGLGIRQARTADAALLARAGGFDWLMIDMEHNSMDLDAAARLIAAALPTGVTPLVRVPGPEHHHAGRALDAGAMGIVVPHVDDADAARAAVASCRFPPRGRRSIPAAMPQLGFADVTIAEAAPLVDDAVLVVVMLETPEAIARADEIAAVPGVDVLLIGTMDLSAALGHPGELDDPAIEAAYRTVCEAAAAHGRHAGMGGVYDPELMRRYLAHGPRLVLAAGDVALLLSASRSRTALVRSVVKEA
jgi:2-keto-3-deoxy-L-rhamnonate aldolase RhmA